MHGTVLCLGEVRINSLHFNRRFIELTITSFLKSALTTITAVGPFPCPPLKKCWMMSVWETHTIPIKESVRLICTQSGEQCRQHVIGEIRVP